MYVCMYVYKEKRRQGHQIFLLLTFIFFCFHDCMIPCASFNLIPFIILVSSYTIILLKGHREYMYYDIRLENLFSQLVTLLYSCFRLHRLYLPTQFLYAVKFFVYDGVPLPTLFSFAFSCCNQLVS